MVSEGGMGDKGPAQATTEILLDKVATSASPFISFRTDGSHFQWNGGAIISTRVRAAGIVKYDAPVLIHMISLQSW